MGKKSQAELTPEELRYRRAKQRVEDIKGFYIHVVVFLSVNGGLLLLDVITGDGWWFFWALIPWGFAMVMHYFSVYGIFSDYVMHDWEERKIQELIAQDEKPKRHVIEEEDEYFEKA